jgi:ABC-type Fe3+-hydroxamate transport system substrate-binding protein
MSLKRGKILTLSNIQLTYSTMDYIDQTGHKITLERPPIRIVSIVPSQTELLYYLGASPVGQTIFCLHPKDEFKTSYKIGGTKKLQLDKIRALKPDLIIGNKEENQKEQTEELREEFPVWLSDIYTLTDATNMIKEVGNMVAKPEEAKELADRIEKGFSSSLITHRGSALYLIWKNPYMAAGRNTFINNILERSGYNNAITTLDSRYPQLSLDEMKGLKPDNILLSSEPFPFKENHIEELKKYFPDTKVNLVDGELYSWYGPRLLKTIESLR